MRQEIIKCDVPDCKQINAKHFQFFHERKMDGAGSPESWFFGFDLCPHHIEVLLSILLKKFEMIQKDELIKAVKALGVTLRDE
jgi:hypothetical protein